MEQTTQDMKKGICSVWEEQSKVNFNLYRKGQIGTCEFERYIQGLESTLGTKDTVVINGGHYIPTGNSKINKNSMTTWEMSCQMAKRLQNHGINSYVSLMVNDLPLSPEERKNTDYAVPQIFRETADNLGIKIMNSSTDKERAYSEKRCSNNFGDHQKRVSWQKYPIAMTEHCINAIIWYLRDIKKQGASRAIFISPKCSHKNMIRALELYNKYERGIENEAYFETNNCFM